MITYKKSLEWLKPVEFTVAEAKKFQESIKKGPSTAILEKQKKPFNIARNLIDRE